ncbi:MAG: ATP-binding protein [Deltaproteobacteria bacterium]|nr:ATP-binding protein [Deltaproteobacteria bacterium]
MIPRVDDFEKLGMLYLGRAHDLSRDMPKDDLVLYDAKDLTTHALCVGMTGSGKTGLCLTLLEEAAIDGVPAIAIDPKGDLANLMLTFPDLRGEDFAPWVDREEAARKGVGLDAFAEETATRWRSGLAEWGQDGARIRKLLDAAEVEVFTPGSNAGISLALLPSFQAPPASVVEDAEAFAARVESAASALLALVGVDANPVSSREHIVLSQILANGWTEGRDLDLTSLVKLLAKPPFDQVGVLDLETFYPAKDRMTLAMSVNNLLASPAAKAWAEGQPLDVARLLRTPAGKPRVAIVSIAHLSDAQRMSFVTSLLSQVLAWVRTQSGTSSLRAILYMDEIAGYFPPTATPPSKAPMLTLLKQARAFGLGVVLATQNPVDLDYKGLSNCGTWFIGRLQTERDKDRVLDGLEGAGNGRAFDRATMDRTLSALGNRVFLMSNVHEDAPIVFKTRWTLSFLRGPLTREQIKSLMSSRRSTAAHPAPTSPSDPRPVLPAEITERFLAATAGDGRLVYRPALLATLRLHHVSVKDRVDHWRALSLLLPLDPRDTDAPWSRAQSVELERLTLLASPNEAATFATTPPSLANRGKYVVWKKSLALHAYEALPLKLLAAPALKLVSRPGEDRADFVIRVSDLVRETRDRELETLRRKLAPKMESLLNKRSRAEEKLRRESAEASEKSLDTAFSLGATLVGAFFGRKAVSMANVGRARSTAKSAGRALEARKGVARAEDSIEALDESIRQLDAELKSTLRSSDGRLDPARLELTEVAIAARKSDTTVGDFVLAWVPWRVPSAGLPEPCATGVELHG